MQYDDLLAHLGECGPYQVRAYILTCLPVIAVSTQTLIPVFILATPNHRCAAPARVNDTVTKQDNLDIEAPNMTLSWYQELYNETEGRTRSQCWINVSRNQSDAGRMRDTKTDEQFQLRSCHRWLYENTDFHSTVVTQMDLVCDRASLRSHASMIYMLGLLIGSITFGIFADVKGRKTSLMTAIAVHVLSSVCLVVSPDYATFVVCRFLTGVSSMGIMLSAFVLGMELMGRTWRTTAGVCINFFWCAGMFLLAVLAYSIRDWRHLQLAASCYTVLFLSLWWLVPESSRWLANQGRMEEARVILKKIAISNKKELPENAFEEGDKDKQQEKVADIVAHPVLTFRLFVVFVNWLVINLVYYGLTFNVGSLGGSVYANFALSGFVEVLGNIATLMALPRMGRKRFHCSAMLSSAAACLLCMVPALTRDSSSSWTTVMLSSMGKFAVTGGYSTIYVFSAELFPTAFRNSIIGSCSMVARLGGMVSPYIADLSFVVSGAMGTALPYIIFGCSGLIAGLLALTLPETLNMTLPETIQDTKELGKKKPVAKVNTQNNFANGRVGQSPLPLKQSDVHLPRNEAQKQSESSDTGNVNEIFEISSM